MIYCRFKSKLKQRSLKKRESGLKPEVVRSQITDFFNIKNKSSNVCVMCGSHRVVRCMPRSPRNKVIPHIRLENT